MYKRQNPNSAVISVEASSSGGTLGTNPALQIYSFQATAGDSFNLLYEWAGFFQDLPDSNTFIIDTIPLAAIVGNLADWTLSLDTDADSFVGTASSDLNPNLQLLDAEFLDLTFTYNGTGTGIIGFGGADLVANPEPTSFLMLGSVGLLMLNRRRKK